LSNTAVNLARSQSGMFLVLNIFQNHRQTSYLN
jgi:hypothetical protein